MPGRNLFKLITGEEFKEATRRPTVEESVNSLYKQVGSRYALRELGSGLEISEEERESHLHILGTTGEGKSRLIEHLIRGDIKQGNGVCFLDPTDRAETAYSILRYCASIGFEKVILIDPHLHKLPCVQPFNYKQVYRNASVSNVMDIVRVLFMTKDAAETPRIQKYLSALLHCLLNAGMTLHEAIYFTDFRHFAHERDHILSKSDKLDRHRLILEDVFRSYPHWEMYFSSTMNRLEPFFNSQLDLMFGSEEGLNFTKLITEGWVILVNLYSGLGFEPIHTRLLGTTVINEVIFALDRLRNRGWRGVYYLYIDEAGRYANRNLADLLAYKRKSGLRVAVAHQFFSQFEDRQVLDAVKQLCKYKIMFDVPNPGDRLEMMKLLGYGGDIPPHLAVYANQNLPKQNAIVKPAKGTPQRIKIVDVPDAKVSREALDSYMAKILGQPWYKTPQEIQHEFKTRIPPKPDTQRPTPGKASDRPPTGKTAVPHRTPKGQQKPRLQADDVSPQSPAKRRPIKI
jgi:hypothetical protein